MANGCFLVPAPRPRSPTGTSIGLVAHLAPSRKSCRGGLGAALCRRRAGDGPPALKVLPGGYEGAAASVTCWTGSSTWYVEVRAGHWWCGASRAWQDGAGGLARGGP